MAGITMTTPLGGSQDPPTLQGIKGNFPHTFSRTPPVSISNQEPQMDILFRIRWSKRKLLSAWITTGYTIVFRRQKKKRFYFFIFLIKLPKGIIMGTGPMWERDLIVSPLQNLKILVPRYKTPIRDSLFLHPPHPEKH